MVSRTRRIWRMKGRRSRRKSIQDNVNSALPDSQPPLQSNSSDLDDGCCSYSITELSRPQDTSSLTGAKSEHKFEDDIIELPRQQDSISTSSQNLLLWRPAALVKKTRSILDDPVIFDLVSKSPGSGLTLAFLDLNHYAQFAFRQGSSELLESSVDEVNCGRYTFKLTRDAQDKIYWSRERLSKWFGFQKDMARLARPFFPPIGDDVEIKDQGNKWQAGADIAIWTRSSRLFPKLQPIQCPYYLHGNKEAVHDFQQDPHVRDRQAWKELSDIIDPEELSPDETNAAREELVKLANAFFSGQEIPEDLGDLVAQVENTKTGDAPSQVIGYQASDWKTVQISDALRRPIMTRFLVDVILCNRLEQCCQHRLHKFYGATVHRNERYRKIMHEIDLSERRNGDLTKDLLDLLKNKVFIGRDSENGESSQFRHDAVPEWVESAGESDIDGGTSKKKKKNRKKKGKQYATKKTIIDLEGSILDGEELPMSELTGGKENSADLSWIEQGEKVLMEEQECSVPTGFSVTSLAEEVPYIEEASQGDHLKPSERGPAKISKKQADQKSKKEETAVVSSAGPNKIKIAERGYNDAKTLEAVAESSTTVSQFKSIKQGEKEGKTMKASDTASGPTQLKPGKQDNKKAKKTDTAVQAASTSVPNRCAKKSADKAKEAPSKIEAPPGSKPSEHVRAQSSKQAPTLATDALSPSVDQTADQQDNVGWNVVKAKVSNKSRVPSHNVVQGSSRNPAIEVKVSGRAVLHASPKVTATIQKTSQSPHTGNKPAPVGIQSFGLPSNVYVAKNNTVTPLLAVSSQPHKSHSRVVKDSKLPEIPRVFDVQEFPALGPLTKNISKSTSTGAEKGLTAVIVAPSSSILDAATPERLLTPEKTYNVTVQKPTTSILILPLLPKAKPAALGECEPLDAVLGERITAQSPVSTSGEIDTRPSYVGEDHEVSNAASDTCRQAGYGFGSADDHDHEESVTNSVEENGSGQQTDIEYLLRIGDSTRSRKSFTRSTRSAPDLDGSDSDEDSTDTLTGRPSIPHHRNSASPRLLGSFVSREIEEPEMLTAGQSEEDLLISPASSSDAPVFAEDATLVTVDSPLQLNKAASDTSNRIHEEQGFVPCSYNAVPSSSGIHPEYGMVGSDMEGTTLVSGTPVQPHLSGVHGQFFQAQPSPTRRVSVGDPEKAVGDLNPTAPPLLSSVPHNSSNSIAEDDTSAQSDRPAPPVVQSPANENASFVASSSRIMSPNSWNNQQVLNGTNGEASGGPRVAGLSVNTSSLPPAAGPSAAPPGDFSTCTYCNQLIAASVQTPLFLCPGCGPTCNIRYCSVECLLVHAFQHCSHCMNTGADSRELSYSLPGEFRYIKHPLLQESFQGESREKHRQRTFFMFCNSGSFPNLMKVWTQVHGIPSNFTTQDILEAGYKKTGDYFLFRSRTTGDATRPNPDADVIFTVALRRGDPLKAILRRTLVACFVLRVPALIEFLFRMLRHLINDGDFFNMLRHTTSQDETILEFTLQFFREFGFEPEMQENEHNTFDANREWPEVAHIVGLIEARHPGLQQWFL